MNALAYFLYGKKTYVVSLVCVVYGVLALTGVVPDPEQLGTWLVVIAAYAATFRAALAKFLSATI